MVAEEFQGLSPEDYNKLWMVSGTLPSIAHNETLDVCMMILVLGRYPGKEKLARAAKEFIASYHQAVVAVSDPPNNGKYHSGLTIWCPRLGDRVSVSKYYQHLRFHKETGWFDAVRRIWIREKAPEKTIGFSVVSVQGPKLVEERGVAESKSLPDGFEEGRFLSVKITPESRPWAGSLKEGVYEFKGYETADFATLEQAREFVELLKQVRRKEEEFQIFETALEHDIVLDSGSAKRVVYEMTKYEIIVIDEFPDSLEVYSTIRELAQKATKDGILLIGKNRT